MAAGLNMSELMLPLVLQNDPDFFTLARALITEADMIAEKRDNALAQRIANACGKLFK